MHGDTLITVVKQQYPTVNTMLMSSYDHVNDAARACGADAWYRKSWDMHRLREIAEAVLGRGDKFSAAAD